MKYLHIKDNEIIGYSDMLYEPYIHEYHGISEFEFDFCHFHHFVEESEAAERLIEQDEIYEETVKDGEDSDEYVVQKVRKIEVPQAFTKVTKVSSELREGVEFPDPLAGIKRRQVAELKAKLAATDYMAIKFAEGQISPEEYGAMRAQRQAWREEINALES